MNATRIRRHALRTATVAGGVLGLALLATPAQAAAAGGTEVTIRTSSPTRAGTPVKRLDAVIWVEVTTKMGRTTFNNTFSTNANGRNSGRTIDIDYKNGNPASAARLPADGDQGPIFRDLPGVVSEVRFHVRGQIGRDDSSVDVRTQMGRTTFNATFGTNANKG